MIVPHKISYRLGERKGIESGREIRREIGGEIRRESGRVFGRNTKPLPVTLINSGDSTLLRPQESCLVVEQSRRDLYPAHKLLPAGRLQGHVWRINSHQILDPDRIIACLTGLEDLWGGRSTCVQQAT